MEKLFKELFFASTENDIDAVVSNHPDIFKQENWFPYGDNESYFGVIENQQASPVPALIEKITNSIDAILMRKCLEAGIDPKGTTAPKSMEEATKLFFPDHKSWDLPSFRKKISENLQIIADGPKMNTSLVVYDNGEGQNPEDFEKTFLSLLRGNKNEIHFVQGKYNMGGSGAIIFCGKKKYHLIASKKYTKKGNFGFTLIRRHPLTDLEKQTKKNTWYEYFKIDGNIPAFSIEELDLGLYGRKFITGTILKLYSYDLPAGARSVISRDLNQSINEYLFEPALPILTVDKKQRYPDDRNLERDLYGLKRRLEEDDNKYVEDYFSEVYTDSSLGTVKVTCYVFKPKTANKTVKESKDTIRREFFKNNMSVLFSLNGQVHGFYTSEFITRSLKFQLLKDYLLIHVDCTSIDYNYRNELFMASRDRLKDCDESRQLRELISEALRKSKLDEIYRRRKDSISIDSGDTSELLKSFTKNLPLNSDLLKLLNQTFKLEEKKEKQHTEAPKEKEEKKEKEPFNPKRFPSYLKFNSKNDGTTPIAKIPLNGEKSMKFYTDVENQYFDRVEEPGELKIALVNFQRNSTTGDRENQPNKLENLLNIVSRSPNNGVIKIVFNPTQQAQVGDTIQIRVTLTNPGNDFDQIFLIKIVEPEEKTEDVKKKKDNEADKIGLPEYILVYKEEKEGNISWTRLAEMGIDMSFNTIMHPFAEGDILEKIYINMDSSVLKSFKSNLKSVEQLEIADKRYISTVYFHTLFLYTITKNRKYIVKQIESEQERDVDLSDYLKDLFESYYSQFLLSFGMSELIQSLEN